MQRPVRFLGQSEDLRRGIKSEHGQCGVRDTGVDVKIVNPDTCEALGKPHALLDSPKYTNARVLIHDLMKSTDTLMNPDPDVSESALRGRRDDEIDLSLDVLGVCGVVVGEGQVGEIWVDSDSKAGGYFNLPDETKVRRSIAMKVRNYVLGRWGMESISYGLIACASWSSRMACWGWR